MFLVCPAPSRVLWTVTPSSSPPFANRLLRALGPADRRALFPHLKAIDLPRARPLETPFRSIGTVCFVEEGIVSIVDRRPGKREVEVGLVGHEGATGIPVFLGADRWHHATYVQVPGRGYAIEASRVRRRMAASPALSALLLRYVQSFMAQISSTVTSRANGNVEQRLARWLLMAHDRIDGDELHITHEFLAVMLVVRRPGVTDAINTLEGYGVIKARRGCIRIVDRSGLERRSGEMYGHAEREYQRLLG